MDRTNDPQDLSFSPSHPSSFSPPTPFARNGIRYNEFREMLNTAVQASQPDRPMQRQAEVLGKFKQAIFKHSCGRGFIESTICTLSFYRC